MTTMTIEEACEIAYGKGWSKALFGSVPINTIHCTNCGCGTDMPGGNKDETDWSYEEKVCPYCGGTTEVTVRTRKKGEKKPF